MRPLLVIRGSVPGGPPVAGPGAPPVFCPGYAPGGRLGRESPSGSRGGRGRPPRSLGSSAAPPPGCAAPSQAGVSRGSPRIRANRSRASARTERSCCGARLPFPHAIAELYPMSTQLGSTRVQKHGTGPWRLFGVRAGQAIACLPAGRQRLAVRAAEARSPAAIHRPRRPRAPDSGHPTTGSSGNVLRSNRKTGFGYGPSPKSP